MQLRQARTKTSQAGGFTLMELVMVMLIMGLLAGFMFFAYEELAEDEALREPSLKLQQLARRASRSSTTQDQAYRIRFEEQQFYVVAGTGDDSSDRVEGRYQLREDVELSIKRWQATEWVVPQGTDWVFAATGLAEPLSVRLERGESYIELDFNPLTGVVDERRSYLP